MNILKENEQKKYGLSIKVMTNGKAIEGNEDGKSNSV